MHAPAAQRGDEFGAEGHARPHAPQFATAPDRFVSQPFPGTASQSPKPIVHVKPHRPIAQVEVAFGALQA